jgi:predicted dehydrogenase
MLRLGVLGAGGRGRISKLAHRPEEGSELVAICDTQTEVHEQYQKTVRPDIAFYTDYRRLLDEAKVDAVFICTPDYLHEEMAVAALERGIGVYLEKPMAITIEGCDRIINTAAAHNAKLYVGHNMRFFPILRKMKEIIDSGRIGQVQAVWCRHFISYGGDAYFKDWHSERKYVTSLLLQKAAHDIDIIHYLGGAPTVRTVGMGKLSVYNQVTDRRAPEEPGDSKFNFANWPPLAQTKLSPMIDVEDHSMMFMQLANGVQASYEQCHYTPDMLRNYTVIGTEGRMENSGDHSTREHEAIIRLWTRRVRYIENGTESISIPPLSGSHGGADPLIVDAFLHYLKTGESTGATPLDARAAVAAGYLATQSLRNGNQPYDVPPLDKKQLLAKNAAPLGANGKRLMGSPS